MRFCMAALILLGSFFYMPLVTADNVEKTLSPVGAWTTIDDQTGKQRAVIEMQIVDGALTGTVKQVFRQDGDKGICSKCPLPFKDKKIEGLQMLWGLHDKGNGSWEGGKILDPKSGKIYSAKLTIKGDKLYVRGYLGVAALGKTQVWVRA